jgi:hypothetical protein
MSGKLGVAAPAATTLTTVYTVPTGKVATFNMCIVNTTGTPITFRVAIASTGTPSSSEWIEYDAIIEANDVWERTALVASAGEQVVVYGSIAGLAVRAYGFEQ